VFDVKRFCRRREKRLKVIDRWAEVIQPLQPSVWVRGWWRDYLIGQNLPRSAGLLRLQESDLFGMVGREMGHP
jgi:hypothetical protein